MEITANEMKESIKRIYERLDEVTPVDFDCGKLCGEVCCVSDADDSDSDVISDKSGKREKTIASDSDEEAGKELSDKKNEEKDLFGSDSESGNEEE